jgi:hypothetical protein
VPIPLSKEPRRQTAPAAPAPDWLSLWAISVGCAAVLIAGLAYFTVGDQTGAAMVLFGAAAIIAIALRAAPPPPAARD